MTRAASPVWMMYVMSGSREAVSGVGTQMLTVSSSRTTAKSVVALRRPDWRSDPTSNNHVMRLLARRNKHGLLSEDIAMATGELWGNYPQTYSLVGLINSAIKLSVSAFAI